MCNLYFWVSFAHNFYKDYIFGSNYQNLGHTPYLSWLALTPYAEDLLEKFKKATVKDNGYTC